MKKQKKIFYKTVLSLTALVFCFSFVVTANAEKNNENGRRFATTTATFSRENKIEVKDLRKEERNGTSTREERPNVRKATTTVEQKREQKRDERLQNYVQMLKVRLMATVGQLESIASRIDSRIKKIEARGIKMEDSKARLAEARIKIMAAKEKVKSISEQLVTLTATSTAKTLNAQAQVLVKDAKTSLNAAHKALVNVINSMKPGQQKVDEMKPEKDKNASTTTETENDSSNSTTTATSTAN